MTRLSPVDRCDKRRGLLVPPVVAARGCWPPDGIDYVCLACGRFYQWTGHPPTLTALSPTDTHSLGDADPACSSDRTRNVGLASHGYQHCEACNCIFRPSPGDSSRRTDASSRTRG